MSTPTLTPIALSPSLKQHVLREWPRESLSYLAAQATRPGRTKRPLGDCKVLQVETTNHCNLRCVECPQRMMQRSRQWMEMDVFTAILTKLIAPYEWEAIVPHKDGESLLFRHYAAMLKTISEVHRGKFIIYTNGTMLTREVIEEIGRLPNRFEVMVSFHYHGADGERYSTEKATETLLACLEMGAENIDWHLVTHKEPFSNQVDMGEWRDFWLEQQGNYPRLRAVHTNTAINPWAGHLEDGIGTSVFPTCPYGDSQHFFVGVTGNVVPCCLDLNEDLVVGNVVTDSVETIMAHRRRFYADVAVPWRRKELCKKCLGGQG